MTPAERDMPTLTAIPEGSGWRMEMPGGTSAWLPDEQSAYAAARGLYAAVRFVRPSRAAALPGASGGASFPEGGRQPTVAEETEGELRALFGDR